MRRRLRPAHTSDELRALYGDRYDHTRWSDHVTRVRRTIELAREVIENDGDVKVVADLSCGDGAVVNGVRDLVTNVVTGDLTYDFNHDLVGPVEETIDYLEPVDLYVCTETLEHIDDPDALLRKIRDRTRLLLLSTPDGERGNDNPEHYWEWDVDGVRELLEAAGFTPFGSERLDLTVTTPGSYVFQFWAAR